MARFRFNQNIENKGMGPARDSRLRVTAPRYQSVLGSLLDQLAYVLLYPWATLLSTLIAFYINTSQPQTLRQKIIERGVFGPLLGFVILLCFPLGLSGLVLWVFVCTFFSQKRYSYYEVSHAAKPHFNKWFTLTSANVLLANEGFSRLNNIHNVYRRSRQTGKNLMHQSPLPLTNLLGPSLPKKDETVLADLPDVDVLCLQEVWERCWAAVLINILKTKYSYFIYDVGQFKLSTNRCMLGSGLFIASKYPVEFADFRTFQYRTKYARYFSYGVLCVKLKLDEDKVAYVSNLHGQAYQGKDTVLYHQLTETLDFINSFRTKTRSPGREEVITDLIAGDFNFDNMSPGDALTQRHPLFHQYLDVCSEAPGRDRSWAVGTELRQQRMHQPEVTDAESFSRLLRSDTLRRRYIIDADVQEQTIALASVEPALNEKGEIAAESWGGMRRIDRILVRRDSTATVAGFSFSTVLAGLTDHIPVSMSLQCK